MGNGYPICVVLPVKLQLKKEEEDSYWLNGDNPFPENMTDDSKFWDGLTIQKFRLDDSS